MTKNVAIVFAGGVGSRMGETALPKQYIEVYDKPILIWTLEHFENHSLIDEVYLACRKNWIDHTQALLSQYGINKVKSIVLGGETAQHSICNALLEARANNSDDTIVLIHDGVRPYITEKLITILIETTKEKGNAITYTPCQETIVISEDEKNVSKVPIRRHTLSVQAPQAFFIDDIINAHNEIRRVNADYKDIVDACTLFNMLGKTIHLVQGNIGNIKITRPEDVFILKGLLKFRENQDLFGLSLLDV